MKRLFDFSLSILLLVFLFIPISLIIISIKLTSDGPVIHWSDRIGVNNKVFRMPKFRTMAINAPNIATHLIEKPSEFITPVGNFLRRTSLDELPQLFTILKGEMTFVGPRPALFNQNDLIELRNKKNIDKLVPGLTGWAQVNGRDELSIPEKVNLDEEYLKKMSWKMDIQILWLTLIKVIKKDSVTH